MTTNIILFLIVVFFANAIQAITGFAGTVLAMPPSILLIGIDQAKVILSVMAFMSCFMISVQQRKEIDFIQLKKIVVVMLVGIIVGTLLYDFVPANYLLTLYGILVVLVGAGNLIAKNKMLLSEKALLVVLIIAGIVHGLFVSGGAFLVIYATQKFPSKPVFRGTISSVWVVLNSILIATYWKDGLITYDTLLLLAYSTPSLFIATYFGTILQKKMNQEVFLKLTYILLIISGVSLLV